MRRRRFQKGSLKPRTRNGKRYWYAQWRENGAPKSKELGLCSRVTKSKAEAELAAILAPINQGVQKPQLQAFTFEEFVNDVYVPVQRGKWKTSTAGTSEQNITFHLVDALGARPLRSLMRAELQALLGAKATTLGFSVVDHLRWHLISIFDLAISENAAERNPARALYTPKCKAGKDRLSLNEEQVTQLLAALELRERLICRLAIFEGMRPGEILALQWHDFGEEHFKVRRRVYRGELDSPKTRKSTRTGGLSLAAVEELVRWRQIARDPRPEGFVFPSENLNTPLSRDNVWRRNIQPRLAKIGLGWANFQVMRRANDNLGRKAGIDDKVLADQRGHTVGVSLDVYANSDLGQKLEAVRKLEAMVIQ